MSERDDDPDFTPDVGEFIEVLEPTVGTRMLHVFEVPLELSLAEALERLADQRGVRPAELAAEIISACLVRGDAGSERCCAFGAG
jgi:hypothetical protein